MSEKNLKIRNQFANKIINKIEKLNNDIKLLAKVDKKLSNGNNQIGGAPSMQHNIRDAQFAVAKARLAIADNQPKIDSILSINELNKASNKQLTEAATSLGVINVAISELSTAIDSLVISDIPDLTQITPELGESFKTIIGNDKTLNTMAIAVSIMTKVQDLKIEYNRQYDFYRKQLGILTPLKKEFIKFTIKTEFIFDNLERANPQAFQYYKNKQTEFNNDFKSSEIYVELNGYKELYEETIREDMLVFRGEVENYNTKAEAYDNRLQLLVNRQTGLVEQYIIDKKAALADGTTLPAYPDLPIYTGMEYADTDLLAMQTTYNTEIDTYYNNISIYDAALNAYNLNTILPKPVEPVKPPLPTISTLLNFGSEAVNIARQAYMRKIDPTGNTYQEIWDNYQGEVDAHTAAVAAHEAAVDAHPAAVAAHEAALVAHTANNAAYVANPLLQPDPGPPPPAPVVPGPPPVAPLLPTIANFDPTIYGPDNPRHVKSLDRIAAAGRAAIQLYSSFSPELKAMFTNEAYDYYFPSNEIQCLLNNAYNTFQFKHDEYLKNKTITDDNFSSIDMTDAIEYSFLYLKDYSSYETIEDMVEAYPHISTELSTLFPSNVLYRAFLINFKYIILF